MHNHDIIFDNENKRIGVVNSECDRANGEFNFNNNKDFLTNKNIITCDNNNAIRFYRMACIIASVAVCLIILLFAYAIRKLRREGKFLWISLNEDIGNYESLNLSIFYLFF